MKVLRGTLTFVLGMIVGIILFVVAIGGTVVALAMAVKVGDLQAKFTDQEIISSDSELYNQTMFDAVKGAITDFQNFDTLSLETLYEHYGISALNGVGGIDFTDKEFYHTPIKQIFGDFSIIVNSFTLRDVSKLTGNNFEDFNLPILTDNLDNNVKTALDNILGSIKGDLTIRTIKTNLIPDFNIENDMLKALQDIEFSKFGSAINAFKLCTFLTVDTDTFVPMGDVFVYVKSDRFEQVSAADLANADYVAKDGAELFFYGATDTDGDDKEDTMIEKELRYVNKGTAEAPNYVVDNSCYSEGFNASENTKVFYRHYEYERYAVGTTYPADTEFFVKGYGNRITAWNNDATPKTFDVYFKGYISLKDLYVIEGGVPVALNGKVTSPTVKAYLAGYKKGDEYVAPTAYTVKDETIKKTSKLVKKDFESDRALYFKVHEGTSSSLLQSFAYLSIAELQDMDDFIDNVTVGDVIKIDDSSSAILKSLKNSKFGEIQSTVDNLTIGEILDIKYSKYVIDDDGAYVYMPSADNYVKYNSNLHSGMTRYARSGEAEPYIYSEDAEGEYVLNGYFAKYSELTDAQKALDPTRYNKEDVEGVSSLIMQALALRGTKLNEMSTVTDKLFIYEIVDVTADDASLLMKSLAKRNSTINDLKTVTDDLEIGEVIEIKDTSSLIMRSLDKHHTKISELGNISSTLTIDEVIEINDSSSRLLKSLKKRGCTIDGLGAAVDDMTLAEVIDIYEYSQVKLYEPTDDADKTRYLVGQYGSEIAGSFVKYDDYPIEGDRYDFNSDTQEYEIAAEGKYVYFERAVTYTSDSNGKYIKSPIKFELATASELGSETPATYKYISVSGNLNPNTWADVLAFKSLAESGNMYFKNETVYEQNIPLCTYLFNQGKDDPGLLNYLYYRDAGTDHSYSQYDGTDLYVKVLGSFIEYDPSNPAHSDMDIYKLHSSTTEDNFVYFVRLDDYRKLFVVWTGSKYELGTDGDTALYTTGVTTRFAKQFCDTVFVKDDPSIDDSLARYAYVDGKYEIYDEDLHAGKEVFVSIPNCFIATQEQVQNLDPGTYVKITLINEKSAAVIRMMQSKKITDMGSVVGNAYIEDLMDISPDNMFDKGAIKTSKINDLGSAMSKMMNTMTIGELLDWSNITDINANVRSAIETATLSNFFKSLSYDPTTGLIYVNMVALYGVEITVSP